MDLSGVFSAPLCRHLMDLSLKYCQMNDVIFSTKKALGIFSWIEQK